MLLFKEKTALITFWATIGKFGLFYFQQLVTLLDPKISYLYSDRFPGEIPKMVSVAIKSLQNTQGRRWQWLCRCWLLLATEIRSSQFESLHGQFYLLSTEIKLYRKEENKEKEAWNCPIFKYTRVWSTLTGPGPVVVVGDLIFRGSEFESRWCNARRIIAQINLM